MKTLEEKKAAQAAAHKRWRESEKGKAYYMRKKNGISEREQTRPEVQANREEIAEEEGK